MSSDRIRVLIVDDHRIVREGIALILEREADIAVIGSAASGQEAVKAFDRDRPDVVLMDLQLPGMSGVDAIRTIRRTHPDARIVVLTMYQGDEDIYRALDAGAATYLLKDSLADDLIRVIREVFGGVQPSIPAEVKLRLDDRASSRPLTQREIAVLELVSQGQRNKEVADRLSISEETVQVHLKNIFAKLQVHDRTGAVYVALRRGIIHIH
jgi:DNA-binding NarL/FixJ family response regulator